MLKEIMEQPFSLKQSMLGRIKNKNIILGGINKYNKKLLNCKRIIIIGCGTSWHTGLIIEYFFEKHLKISTRMYMFSLTCLIGICLNGISIRKRLETK